MSRCHQRLALFLGLAGIGLVSVPCFAQRTTFTPFLALRYIYMSNVDFVATPENEDSILRAAVVLPVNRTWKTGSLDFLYGGYVERFDKFEDLNHVAHKLRLGVAMNKWQRSSLGFGLRYSHSQNQGGPLTDELDEDLDGTFTRRIWTDAFFGRLTFGHELGRRWRAGFGVEAGRLEFDEVIEDEPLIPPARDRDRSEQRAWMQLGRQVSPFTTVGFLVRYRRFDLDLGGVTEAISGGVTMNRVEGERLNWGLEAGAFVAERQEDEVRSDSRRTGIQGRFRLTRGFRRTSLTFVAQHRLNSGGVRVGTSVNSDARLRWIDTFHRRWRWGLFARYGRRDPYDTVAPAIEAYEAGAGLRFELGRRFGLSVRAGYGTQTSESDTDTFVDFYRAVASLVWAPFGRMDLSQDDFF